MSNLAMGYIWTGPKIGLGVLNNSLTYKRTKVLSYNGPFSLASSYSYMIQRFRQLNRIIKTFWTIFELDNDVFVGEKTVRYIQTFI